MGELLRTIFVEKHRQLSGKLVEFGGWEMPIQYPEGIIKEHMATRQGAGVFDVSHMGRLHFKGGDTLSFLQHVLTNNAAALDLYESQYTLIQNEDGGAIDDAYLYRFHKDEYLLVVNASNREKDIAHFIKYLKLFPGVEMEDKTFETSMISLQGPDSKSILQKIITDGTLPEPYRNQLSSVAIGDANVDMARTGYTGEPIAFELFVDNSHALEIWDLLINYKAHAIGLGARDTLRLEAGLPLYGHELGMDHDGLEIPVFASKLSSFAVSFSPLKGDFIGKQALYKQHLALKSIVDNRFEDIHALPKMVLSLAITGKGIARAGYKVFCHDLHVGYITSGSMIPFQTPTGSGLDSKFDSNPKKRAVALALINSDLTDGTSVEIEIRNKRCAAVVVPYHISSQAPPHVRSIPHDMIEIKKPEPVEKCSKTASFVKKALTNHSWRQRECVNLIPSEMSQSFLTRVLSMSDPVNRYAEHKEIKAFSGEDVFYYQGTSFIEEVEALLNGEFKTFFDCKAVESRVISGQMANTAFFSALVDYINRADRKNEQRRISKVLNNHIIRGGHLSAQPMGALRDFVARDPRTERAAVVNFPVLRENPYKIDINACEEIIATQQPELVILGKSMVLHREPVREIRKLVDDHAPSCIVMYDMAHVLGLYGPHFQEPLNEGAHIITGSTHKTFFGTQRGVIASNFTEGDPQYDLWEAVKRRTFPGSVSNHHLGTMTGLLFAAYEINEFKDSYQSQVIVNAKAFAKALSDEGLNVEGDSEISFTETHQVLVDVGYGKGAGAAVELEKNNIIVNYQATPEEEGFTASGALRIGVSEMTRFGMKEADFKELAVLMADIIIRKIPAKDKVIAFRQKFLDMKYCFKPEDLDMVSKDLFEGLS